MAVTPANQTFRVGILPVLLNVPVNFDVADTDLDTNTTELTAQSIFNFQNESLRFAGFDVEKTKSGTADVFCRCAVFCKDTPITSYLDPDIIGAATNLSYLDLLGKKAIAGLPLTAIGPSNVCNPRVSKNFSVVLILGNSTGAPVTDVNASCFMNMKFVPEKSVVKITA